MMAFHIKVARIETGGVWMCTNGTARAGIARAHSHRFLGRKESGQAVMSHFPAMDSVLQCLLVALIMVR